MRRLIRRYRIGLFVGMFLLLGWNTLSVARQPVEMEKEPYLLFSGQNTEMDILWQLTGTESCTIEWGFDDTYTLGSAVTTEYERYNQHRFTFPDLEPDSVYYYQVTAAGNQYTGTFLAAPPSDSSRLKFFAYGDTRSYPLTHDWVASAMVDAYIADPEYQTFALHVGDLVSNGNSEEDWNLEFFDSSLENVREMMAHIPLQACMGNHEGNGLLFVKYFPYPFVDGRYWSFDYGPAHIVVIDQYVAYSPGSTQLEWIESDLAATDKEWKFMLFHDPGWSAGGHTNELPVQLYLQPLCVEYGVSICFAGHNHYYARAVVDGVHHITTGGGGAPLYEPDPEYPYVVAMAQENHFCKIDIDGSTLEFTAITPDGEVLDAFSIGDVAAIDSAPVSLVERKLAISPNPFNPRTTVVFTMDRPQSVNVSIFDLNGRRVARIADGEFGGGSHTVEWNGRNSQGRAMPSGTYIVRLETESGVEAKKVMLVR